MLSVSRTFADFLGVDGYFLCTGSLEPYILLSQLHISYSIYHTFFVGIETDIDVFLILRLSL